MALEKALRPLASTLVRKVGEQAARGKPFYSPVDQAIANITQGKGTGAQMLAELMKTKGVAKELKDRPAIKKALEQPKVTKQELEQVAAENPPPQVQHRESDTTEYEQWQMPGGENRRNILLRLPNPAAERNADLSNQIRNLYQGIGYQNERMAKFPHLSVDAIPSIAHSEQEIARLRKELAALPRTPDMYESGHFDEKNILAHARVADYYDKGKKILLIDEIQSDWHQAARDARKNEIKRLMKAEGIDKATASERVPQDFGYLKEGESPRLTGEPFQLPDGTYGVRWSDGTTADLGWGKAEAQRIAAEGKQGQKLPDAPFKQNWHELVIKRLLDDAARNGYDKVVITPGAEQAKRYDLSKQISKIEYEPIGTSGQYEFVAFNKAGVPVIEEDEIPLSRIEELVGKGLAKKIEADEGAKVGGGGYRDWREIAGVDLNVGGEGMTGFYDQIVPSYLNDYGKKYGVTVGTHDLVVPRKNPLRDIQEAVDEGYITAEEAAEMNPYQRRMFINQFQTRVNPVHSFDITPQMREDITTKGMPLYQVAPPVAIGAGAAMQEEEPTDYGKGGTVKRVVNAVLPKGQQAVLPAAESVANLEKFLAGSAVKDRLYHATSRGGFSTFDRNKTTEWRQPSMDTVGSWFSNNPSEAGGAGMYASGESASIYPVHLSIKNPKVYSTFNDFLKDMHSAAGREMPKSAPGLGSTEELRQKLKAEGYDGIAFEQTANESLMQDIQSMQDAVKRARMEELSSKRAEREPYTMKRERLEQTLDSMRKELGEFGSSTEFDQQRVFVPFDATQIKSAIGNRGTYDITDPDINMAGGGLLKKAAKGLLPKGQQAVLPAAESAANLERFLADSAVKDRAYHGTQADFYEFKSGPRNRLVKGMWFTSNPESANFWAGNTEGSNVMPVHLSLKNPAGREEYDSMLNSLPDDKKRTSSQRASQLKKLGHDGLIVNEGTDNETYIAFNPNQIKSAIGNRGTYDINEADINKAKGGQVSKDAMWMAVQNKQLRKKHGN